MKKINGYFHFELKFHTFNLGDYIITQKIKRQKGDLFKLLPPIPQFAIF